MRDSHVKCKLPHKHLRNEESLLNKNNTIFTLIQNFLSEAELQMILAEFSLCRYSAQMHGFNTHFVFS